MSEDNGLMVEMVRQMAVQNQTLGDIKAIAATTASSLEQHRAEMLGPNGHITSILADKRRKQWQDWAKTVVVIPVIFGLNKIARILGWVP